MPVRAWVCRTVPLTGEEEQTKKQGQAARRSRDVHGGRHCAAGYHGLRASSSATIRDASGKRKVLETATDSELVTRSLTAPDAFRLIIERHARPLHRYAARRLGHDDAEDVVSEAFAVAFARRAVYDIAHPNALPWLYGITTNVIRSHRRREARALRAATRAQADARTSEPSQNEELGPALAAALAAMRSDHRDAILLHTLADLTYDEIAEALGVPIGTVRAWISRARATAARELARHGILAPTTPMTARSDDNE